MKATLHPIQELLKKHFPEMKFGGEQSEQEIIEQLARQMGIDPDILSESLRKGK